MKFLTSLVFSLLFFSSQAGQYEDAMHQSLILKDSATTVLDFQNVVNQFSRIAQNEKSEWLPSYHQAHCLIIMSFISKEEASVKDGYLDQAQECLDQLKESQPKESEVYCLQSLLHTARLVIDPMNRGQQMMQASGQAIVQALELDPNNARAKYLLLSNEVGQASFFGQDTSVYCDRISALYSSWPEANEQEDFYPKWGKDETKGLLRNCK